MIIGDIVIPYSYRDKRYLDGIEQWSGPRIESALNVSEKAADMENNAQLGIKQRKNEFPITKHELLEILRLGNWRCEEIREIYYTTKPRTADCVILATK